MTELEVICTVAGGLIALGMILGFTVVRAGMLAGQVSLRIVAPEKRPERPAEGAQALRGVS